ncbi:MAG: biotin carboxylase N-terminal domain-containing protein [Collinsella aerofaciens]
MFDKVLIANRGEVAVRVIRACRDMGIKTVAVYSTADADALHVQLADEAYCIGGPRLAESYLNDDAVLTCAVKSGAKAIHPGYGFFSEGELCARLRQVRSGVCRSFGRGYRPYGRQRCGAERLPLQACPSCRAAICSKAPRGDGEAERIGLPVLIKARAGGGGRGIRR